MDAIARSSSAAIPALPVQGESASQENKKSIEDLPTNGEQLLEKINTNKKISDIFINIWIANKDLPPALFYSVLHFYVREKDLDLKAALTLAADTAESKESQANQGAGSMKEDLQKFYPYILLKKSSSEEDYTSNLKEIFSELHGDNLGKYIIKLIQEQPAVLHSQELLQENLLNVPDNQIGIILLELAKKMGGLELDTLQSNALYLLEGNWSNILYNDIGSVLYEITKGMADLEGRDIQSRALYFLEENLSYITGSQLGNILHELIRSASLLKTPDLQFRACNLCIENLKKAFEKQGVLTCLTSQQLSEIIIALTHILINHRGPRYAVSQLIKLNILELFETSIPYLYKEGLSEVLKIWSSTSLKYWNKTGKPVPVFDLVEASIDQFPLSERVFILQWVAQNLPDAHEANGPSMVAFIEQKLGSISGISQ